MGNRLATAIGHCCQPFNQEERQVNLAKIERSTPKINIVLVNDQIGNKTQSKLTSNPTNNIQNYESTASTHFQTPTHLRMNSLEQFKTINMDDVNVKIVNDNKDKNLKIPFSVIRLTISKKLLRNMNRHCQQLLGRFQQENNAASPWTLTKKGHYVSIINETFISIFTQQIFYEGQAKQNLYLQEFVPNKNGLLVTQQGIYKGNFLDGKAHGKGTFIYSETRTTFKGEWKQGILINGIIQNQEIKYIGQLKNQYAQGKGKLTFKKGRGQYNGWFKQGNFQGEECILICPRYTYEGSFKGGVKCGKGSLVESQQKIDMKIGSTKIKKYRPSSNILGEWQNDNLITIINQN